MNTSLAKQLIINQHSAIIVDRYSKAFLSKELNVKFVKQMFAINAGMRRPHVLMKPEGKLHLLDFDRFGIWWEIFSYFSPITAKRDN